MNQRISVYMRSALRQVLLVSAFSVIQWVSYNVIMSIVAFFHFRLDHGLNIINEWVFDNGWEIVMMTKVISTYLFLKFILVVSIQRKPFKHLFFTGILFPGREVLISLAGFIFFFIFAGGGELEPASKGNFLRAAVIYAGVSVYYLTDIFVLLAIQKMYPIREKYRLMLSPVLALIIVLISRKIFPFAKGMDSLVFSNLVLSQVLIGWRRHNWTLPGLFVLVLLSPAAVLLGLDPIAGEEFSLFVLSEKIGGAIYFAIVLLSASYLYYKRKTDEKSLLI